MAGPSFASNVWTPSPGVPAQLQPVGYASASSFQDALARNLIAGTGAASTGATNGFAYTQTGAGVPVGVPAVLPTGSAPLYVDTTDTRAYAYYSGAWNNLSTTAAPTWAAVLLAGNSSGASNALMSNGTGIGFRGFSPSADQIAWGTGGTFTATTPEIIGPTDTGMFLSAGPSSGSNAGRAVTITASNASTLGVGGAFVANAGTGVGAGVATGGPATLTAGSSTGTSAGQGGGGLASIVGGSGSTGSNNNAAGGATADTGASSGTGIGTLLFKAAPAGASGSAANPSVTVGTWIATGLTLGTTCTLYAGTGAAATNTTTGFVSTQSGAGVPSGVPAPLLTGSSPLFIDTTDNRVYAYTGGAWNNVSAASGANTWASTLAAGNTSGANNAIISASQNIQWATGGTFSASAAEILGPTDTGMFVSARPPAGSAAGNPIQVTGSNATTAGAGGSASLVAGNGVGTNQAVGTAVINSGGSTGNANGDAILFKAPPVVTGSGSGANAPATVAKFAVSNSAAGSAYNFVANATGSALATTATDGFVHIGSSAGVPAGTPTLYTGANPITIDSTNVFLYFYAGGAWQKITSSAATWAQVLAAGNTSGAHDAVMSASQKINWATGGTFSATAPELLGPTDTGFFISAGQGGAGTGNNITVTAANGITTGSGGDILSTAGNGAGANQTSGRFVFNAGNSTGNATRDIFLFQGPPANTASSSATNTAVTFAKFAISNSFSGSPYNFVANATGSTLNLSATDGFVHVGSSAGTPVGTPTLYTGAQPVTIDSTNNVFYFYSGGSWRSAGGGASTWAQTLTAGNTSGATSAIMSSSQNISWATGGTFSASAAELLGPTDAGFFISARSPAGSASGNAVTITAANATTSGVGGAIAINAGGGAGDPGSPNSKGGNITLLGGTASGTSNAAGTITLDSGTSTGNRQFYAVVIKGAPIGASGTGQNTSVPLLSIDGIGVLYIGAQPTSLQAGIGNSINFQFAAASTGTPSGPGGINWTTGWGSALKHIQGPSDQDLQVGTVGSTHSLLLLAGGTGSNYTKVGQSNGSSSGSTLQVNKITSAGGGTGLTLTGTGSGILLSQDTITQYNGINTGGQGVSPIYASGRFTGQNAQKATVCTYTPTADGTFDVIANVNVTVSTNFSFHVVCSYTDETNTAQTLILPFIQPSPLVGAFISIIGLLASTNTTPGGPYDGQPCRIRVKASTAITIGTDAGTYTTVTYNIDASIKQVI